MSAVSHRPLLPAQPNLKSDHDSADGHDSALIVAMGPLVDLLVDRAVERVAELLPAPVDCSPWLDADGAAAYIAATRDRIYDLVQLRKLEPRRDGRRLVFRREDLDAYLEASR
jgi:excisionase family DNA binding protein